jgi:hypothetical protein
MWTGLGAVRATLESLKFEALPATEGKWCQCHTAAHDKHDPAVTPIFPFPIAAMMAGVRVFKEV